MKKVALLKVFFDRENYLDTQPTAALVVLTKELKELIEARTKLVQAIKKEDSSFYQAEFWDYRVDWLDLFAIDEELMGKLDDQELLIVDRDSLEIEEGNYVRTECDCMVVPADGEVLFRSYVKHTSIGISTSHLKAEDVEG